VLVISSAELIANKVAAFYGRRGVPKAFTDRRDLAVLLLRFPELKSEDGPVRQRLDAVSAGPEILETWKQIVSEPIVPGDEDSEFE
jgi:hypothetical protein